MNKASNVVRLVLAGTHEQADKYARSMGWQLCDWRYISNLESAYGYKDMELHKVGTWYERDDITEILDVLEAEQQNKLKGDHSK